MNDPLFVFFEKYCDETPPPLYLEPHKSKPDIFGEITTFDFPYRSFRNMHRSELIKFAKLHDEIQENEIMTLDARANLIKTGNVIFRALQDNKDNEDQILKKHFEPRNVEESMRVVELPVDYAKRLILQRYQDHICIQSVDPNIHKHLKPLDQIIEINGINIDTPNPTDVYNIIKNSESSVVNILFTRPKFQPILDNIIYDPKKNNIQIQRQDKITTTDKPIDIDHDKDKYDIVERIRTIEELENRKRGNSDNDDSTITAKKTEMCGPFI